MNSLEDIIVDENVAEVVDPTKTYSDMAIDFAELLSSVITDLGVSKQDLIDFINKT